MCFWGLFTPAPKIMYSRQPSLLRREKPIYSLKVDDTFTSSEQSLHVPYSRHDQAMQPNAKSQIPRTCLVKLLENSAISANEPVA